MFENRADEHAAAERRFIENLQRMRKARGWSQSELARRMVDAGWKNYSQMTVSRTEKFDRPLPLSEAGSLAALLGSGLEQMMQPELDVRALEELRFQLDSLSQAETNVHMSIRMFEHARDGLRAALTEVERLEHDLTGKSAAALNELLNSSRATLARSEERTWQA